MKPQPATFSKERPCTKRHIWACFRTASGFVRVPLVDAYAIIGINVPRGLEKMGRMRREFVRGVEYCELTPEGEEWLEKGIEAYCRNHPAERAEIEAVSREGSATTPSAGRVRRIRR